MIEDSVVGLISNVGFPIAMCIYLIIRFERTLGKNTEAIDNLKEVIENGNKALYNKSTRR